MSSAKKSEIMGAGQSSKASKVASDEALALAKRLKDGEITGELELKTAKYGDAGLKVIAEELKSNSTITKVLLSQTRWVGDAGMASLADALKTNTSVKELVVSEARRVGDAGAIALAEVRARSDRPTLACLSALH